MPPTMMTHGDWTKLRVAAISYLQHLNNVRNADALGHDAAEERNALNAAEDRLREAAWCDGRGDVTAVRQIGQRP